MPSFFLGSGDFVERLREEVASLTLPSPLVPLDKIMQYAAAAFGIQAELLGERRRDHVVADARATTCCLAVRRYGYSGVEVAKALNISRSGVSVAVKRGAEIMRAKPTLLEELVNNSTTL
jgi:chromosomal replication initiation ATPase DnaA